LFLIAGSIIILVAFPLEEQSTTYIYNYDTQMNEYMAEASVTPLFLILMLAFGIFVWFCAQDPFGERSILRDLSAILHDPVCSQILSNHSIKTPFHIPHEQDLGESSLGHLVYGMVLNRNDHPIHMLAVANDNYNTTETRQRVKIPIIAHSSEVLAVQSASSLLKPSERKTFEQKLRSINMQMKDMAPEDREYYRKKTERQEEAEKEEYNE